MQLPNLGRLPGRVVQYAYTCPDIDAAIEDYVSLLGVGPWFKWGPFTPARARYRGTPATMTISLARSFVGETMIELVQQHDANPSIYQEVIEARGHGFHHFAIATTEPDADIARFVGAGYPVVFEDIVPAGARVTYVDTRAALPGMVEILEMNAAMEQTYRTFRSAAAEWDGTDPVRSG